MRYDLSFYYLRFFMVTEKINTPGEHLFSFAGEVGPLEAALTVPDDVDNRYIAILGHPHSLQGGTMTNKVVTTLARTFKELHIPSIRFNFRGVGQSAGAYDDGLGESADMLLLAHQCLKEMPGVKLVFAGFSFGSYVTYRAAAQSEHALLISIAPPVHHYNYTEFSPSPRPWIIAQGDDDEVVPLPLVLDFVAQSSPPIPLLRFAETGHFFHGKLIELKSELIKAIHAAGV
jgi:alpha/beta superfamily hydrolase